MEKIKDLPEDKRQGDEVPSKNKGCVAPYFSREIVCWLGLMIPSITV
jgi:hypothetical protein